MEGIDKQKIRLATKRLNIKVLEIKHITQKYIDGLNDPEVNRFLVDARLQKQTYGTVKNFIEKNFFSNDSILFGIFLKENDKLIGTVRIHNISYFHYLCSLGISIFDKNCWNKGYALEALREVAEFIFGKLKLHYIEAGVYKENRVALNLFQKAGFKKMSIFKNKYRYSNDFMDVIFFSLTNPNFDYSLLR